MGQKLFARIFAKIKALEDDKQNFDKIAALSYFCCVWSALEIMLTNIPC
jgi:hypothetical protein